jgi:hypothetical protein
MESHFSALVRPDYSALQSYGKSKAGLPVENAERFRASMHADRLAVPFCVLRQAAM